MNKNNYFTTHPKFVIEVINFLDAEKKHTYAGRVLSLMHERDLFWKENQKLRTALKNERRGNAKPGRPKLRAGAGR